MNLLERYHDYIQSIIDDSGIYPFPGMATMPDGTTVVAALCDAETALDWFWKMVTIDQAAEVIFGLDRSTADGQGTEFADVLTCVHWADGIDDKAWDTSFRIGVINYQDEPRVVRQFDFDNEFWCERMAAEVKSRRPPFRMKLTTAMKTEQPQSS